MYKLIRRNEKKQHENGKKPDPMTQIVSVNEKGLLLTKLVK